jgi:hypothetical protein
MTQLDQARQSSNKTQQLHAATIQLALWSSAGQPQRGAELFDTIHPEPQLVPAAMDARAIGQALTAVLDPTEAHRDRLGIELQRRLDVERDTGDRRAVTAIVFNALALARYQSAPMAERASERSRLEQSVRVTLSELESRLESSSSAQSMYPGIYLQAFLLAENDSDAVGYLRRVSNDWLMWYGALLGGIRWYWQNDLDRAAIAFERCANDRFEPAVASRCARWRAHVASQRNDSAAHRRWSTEAARWAQMARTTDGPLAVHTGPGPAADVMTVAIARPEPELDLETWQLRYQWRANISWIFAPDVPSQPPTHPHGSEHHHHP